MWLVLNDEITVHGTYHIVAQGSQIFERVLHLKIDLSKWQILVNV